MSLKSGSSIPIEFRKPDELIWIKGVQIAPKDIKVYNPAFDVTPNLLVSAIVTDVGVFKPPYKKSLIRIKKLFDN